jgi:hypothetical protein
MILFNNSGQFFQRTGFIIICVGHIVYVSVTRSTVCRILMAGNIFSVDISLTREILLEKKR